MNPTPKSASLSSKHEDPSLSSRRPIKSRGAKWVQSFARSLAKTGIQPNHISILSIAFGALAGSLFMMGSEGYGLRSGTKALILIGAACCIQFRLLCNLFDGILAIEFGKKSKMGGIYNDLPDRFADVFILLGLGYSVGEMPWGKELAWLAALLAVLTAYVRVLGASLGTRHYYSGPMAKQHRMALVTIAALIAAVDALLGWGITWLYYALIIVVAGALITVIRRFFQISCEMDAG